MAENALQRNAPTPRRAIPAVVGPITETERTAADAALVEAVHVGHAAPPALLPGHVAALQRTIGNQAVARLIQRQAGQNQQRTGGAASSPSNLPGDLRAKVEAEGGVDLSGVRVHYNSDRAAEVGALAYTQGADIHVGPGQEQYLPHEAWHVVQQRQGRVKPTMQLKGGVAINDDAGLEQEADVMGARAMQRMVEATPSPVGAMVDHPDGGPIQRVATGLIAGLDADKPSTYDTGGGHSYADHGAKTEKEAHITRVKTGVAPSGRVSKVPKGKPSSKFASDDTHKLAFSTALAALKETNKNKQKVKGAANQIDVAGAGTLFYEDGSEVASAKVQLDIQPVDDTTIRINSMYPVEG